MAIRAIVILIIMGVEMYVHTHKYRYGLEMYVCMVITYSRVWINRVRLPTLLVVG